MSDLYDSQFRLLLFSWNSRDGNLGEKTILCCFKSVSYVLLQGKGIMWFAKIKLGMDVISFWKERFVSSFSFHVLRFVKT